MVDHRRRRIVTSLGTIGLLSAPVGAQAQTQEQEQDSDTELTIYEPATDEDGEQASNRVRIVHMASDVGTITATLHGDTYAEEIQRYSPNDDYSDCTPGTHELVVTEVETGETILETMVALPGGVYTIAIAGEQCADAERPLTAHVFEDDNSPTPAGMSRIRGAHTAPDAPTIDMRVDGTTVLPDIAYGDAVYAEVPIGEEVMSLHDTETDEELFRFEIAPREGEVHTGFGVGYVDPATAPEAAAGQPFALVISDDAAPGVDE